jgi:hypothetical protein
VPIRGALGGALLSGVAALALYAFTLAPTVGFVDSGELITAVSELGVPHPPGFPLYVLLTHPITRIPVGTVAARVNFASAVYAAAAIGTLFLLVHALARRTAAAPPRAPASRKRPRTARGAWTEPTAGHTWVALTSAFTVALVFASLRTPWSYATVAEVYTLAMWLVVTVWLLMAHCRMKAAAFVFGLALGVHPAMNLAMLPALAVLVYRVRGQSFFASRDFAIVALVAAAGLTVYLYLPLAAMQSPPLNWGDARTPERFWAHVSGWQYRGSIDMTAAAVGDAVGRLGRILVTQFGGRWPAGAASALVLLGAVSTYRTDRTVFWVATTFIAVNIVLTVWMNAAWSAGASHDESAADDLDAYYLPALIAGAVLAGCGTARLLTRVWNRRPVWPLAVAGALAAMVVASAAGNFAVNDRRDDRIARQYADDVLRSMADGLLLTRDWQISAPLLYVQHVERERVGVAALNLNLLERSWYLEDSARRYPSVYARVHAELAAYRSRLSAWESDGNTFNADDSRRRGLASAFDELVTATVAAYLETGRVYMTREVALALDGKGATLAREWRARYQLVPQGLLFELRRAPGLEEPGSFKMNIAPILEARRRVAADHIVRQRIAPAYSDMLANRGLYLESRGRCGEAVTVLADALSIEPAHSAARATLARCRSRTTP